MRSIKRSFLILLALFSIQGFSFGQSVTIGIGSSSGTAGSTVDLPITLTSSGGAQAAGLQWSFNYSSDITGVTVVVGSSATNAGKSVTCSGNNCLILGFNSTAMADGTVAIATFQIAANPSTTSIPVQISGVVASTASGASIPASGGSGTITVPGNFATVSVGVSPSSATLTASQSRQFTATVGGNINTSVVWSMSPALGTLSNGLYTAPSVINSAQSVTITATSAADPTKSASATVQLTPVVNVGVSPSSTSLAASQNRQFAATVTGSANTGVTWSMSPSVGSLSNGLYTAPSVINSAQSVTITATSVADPTKFANATVQLTPSASVSIGVSPSSATLSSSQGLQFSVTVTGAANTSVTWSMSPAVGTLVNGFYASPAAIPASQVVTITATSVADPTKSASATVQLTPTASVSIGVSPLSANLMASQSAQFAATVAGSANTAVAWSMSPSVGSLSNGLYTAPSVVNTAQSVVITATSVADPTKSASATVQLTPNTNVGVSVAVSPSSASLRASQIAQFAATVTGNANTSVTWSMSPSAGSLSNGLYTAPSVINTPQSVVITATSVADPTKSASATVQLAPNVNVIVSVAVSPQSASLAASQTAQFAANVTGNANTSITWSMSPSAGTLSNGLYTAPSAITTAQTVVITATSVADPTKSASATVQLTPTSTGTITITSPTSQPTFTSTQNRISLAGTAPANTTEVVWATDQGVVGQATGTTNWTANGIVLRNGSNRITVTARNSAGNQSSVAITAVYSALAIVTTSLPDAQLGHSYTAQLAAVGGTPPLTWLAASMPDGLAVSKDGKISGTAGSEGTFTIQVTVQDASQTSVSAPIMLRVDNGLMLVSAATLRSGPVAPDSMVTVFGGELASGAQSATQQPLPTTLGDSSVTVTDVNGVARNAGLYYVSPSQINFKVPTDTAPGAASITVTSGGRTQVLGNVGVADVSPGLFFLNSDGLAAADVTRVNGSITTYEEVAQLDAASNQFVAVPIDLGSATDKVYLTFYGTGFRKASNLKTLQIFIANVPVTVDFAGASPSAEGLDVVRVLLPRELRGTGMASVGITVNSESSNAVRVLIK